MRSSVSSAGVADTMCKLDIPRTAREATPFPMTPTAAPAPPAPPRAQLIHIETDRRLGHEWDEWDGRPLPNLGDFSAPARLFFGYAALTLVVALGVAAAVRYDVPVFVATRGQLARRVIRERRPRAVVAVACERDMMTGLRDVAGKLPVLGLTMRLPNGPCRDAELDLDRMDVWVRGLVGA